MLFGKPMSAAEGALLGAAYSAFLFRFLFSWSGVIFLFFAVAYYNNWFAVFNLFQTPQIPPKPDLVIERIKSPTYQPRNSFEYQTQGKELIQSLATWAQGMRDLYKNAELSKANPVLLASAYSSIAIGYARKGDRDQAIQYFKSSIEINERQVSIATSGLFHSKFRHFVHLR